MKEPKEYLKKELKQLLNKFQDIQIRYEFDEDDFVHIIEVTPLAVYESDKTYVKFEIELRKKFAIEFPNEEIMFVSEDSLTKIETPEFVLSNPSVSADLENYFGIIEEMFSFEIKSSRKSCSIITDIKVNSAEITYNSGSNLETNNMALAA
jgi:hypothetical protein